MKDKITPTFQVLERHQVGLVSKQAGCHSPEESRKVTCASVSAGI